MRYTLFVYVESMHTGDRGQKQSPGKQLICDFSRGSLLPSCLLLHASSSSYKLMKCVLTSAWNEGYPNVPEDFTITVTEKAPTRAFSWLKAATSAFTFKTLLRHYAKQTLTPRSLNVKSGPIRGLLRDCEIFGNIRITFVSSTSQHTTNTDWMAPLR